MGNLSSRNQYTDRKTMIREIWKALRVIPALPINSALDVLRVLVKKEEGFYDVGSVYTLCKPGKDREWLREFLYPQRRLHRLLQQQLIISDDDGALATLLVDPENGDAWFQDAESIQIRVSDCEVLDLDMENWAEMIQRFEPDLQTLGPPGRTRKRNLFIVQRVLLVSLITITASYKTAGRELDPVLAPLQGVNLVASDFRATSSGGFVREFTLSPAHKNRKLPVAFSGFRYTYDKYGNREGADGKKTQAQADAEPGAAAPEDEAEAEEEEAEAEEEAQADEHVGWLLEDNVWFTTVFPCTDPSQHEIMDALPPVEEEAPPADAGEGQEEHQEEQNVVDQNAPDMEDID